MLCPARRREYLIRHEKGIKREAAFCPFYRTGRTKNQLLDFVAGIGGGNEVKSFVRPLREESLTIAFRFSSPNPYLLF